jgi:hypothetical protein
MNGWATENWNEVNIFENRFLDEFKLAQANLRARPVRLRHDRQPRLLVCLSWTWHWHVPLPTYLA